MENDSEQADIEDMSEGCAFHYDLDLKVTDSMPEENDTMGDKIIELYDEEE